MTIQRIRFQLKDQDWKSIQASGGQVQVCTAGSASKQAITDKDGAALSNPLSLTNGGAEFYIAGSVTTGADLYIQTPGDQFLVKTSVMPGAYDFEVNTNQRYQVAKIPFSIADCTTGVEKDSGFNVPNQALVLPDVAIVVATAESGKTIDVGLLSSESGGDANGFVDAISLTSAVLVAAKSASTNTRGALIGAGTLDRGHATDSVTAKSISYTLASTVTAAKGFILMPWVLAA